MSRDLWAFLAGKDPVVHPRTRLGRAIAEERNRIAREMHDVVAHHDVFHGRRPWPVSEGAEVLRWLRGRGIGYLTASRAGNPDAHDHLLAVKRRLRMAAPVHAPGRDPMLFFSLP